MTARFVVPPHDHSDPLEGDQLDATVVDYKDGETVREILDETVYAGLLHAIEITDAGGLDVTWIASEVYTPGAVIQDTDAGSVTCTDNTINYLVWTGGSTVVVRTTQANHDTEIELGRISCQNGDIWEIHEQPTTRFLMPGMTQGLEHLFPLIVGVGLIISEDADATNPLDVSLSAGTIWHDAHESHDIAQVDSRTGNILIRCNINGSGPETWNLVTAQHSIDIANWNNGTVLSAVTNNKYYKGLFLVSEDNIFWVYAQAQYNNIADALAAGLPSIPPGFDQFPRSVSYIHKGGDTAFVASSSNRWADVRPRIGFAVPSGVTDHDDLAGLTTDNHHAESHTLASHSDGDQVGLRGENHIPMMDVGTVVSF